MELSAYVPRTVPPLPVFQPALPSTQYPAVWILPFVRQTIFGGFRHQFLPLGAFRLFCVFPLFASSRPAFVRPSSTTHVAPFGGVWIRAFRLSSPFTHLVSEVSVWRACDFLVFFAILVCRFRTGFRGNFPRRTQPYILQFLSFFKLGSGSRYLPLSDTAPPHCFLASRDRLVAAPTFFFYTPRGLSPLRCVWGAPEGMDLLM